VKIHKSGISRKSCFVNMGLGGRVECHSKSGQYYRFT
jgi:hypothetical protein